MLSIFAFDFQMQFLKEAFLETQFFPDVNLLLND